MLNIGCHLSSSKGFLHMGKEALSLGGNTFQFFTRNPRGGSAKEMNVEDAKALMTFAEENNFAPLLAHAPYTLNPCSADEKVRNFAYMCLSQDLERMEQTPGNLYNFHPGSHVGQGLDVGINMISDLLNKIITPEQTTIVLLETMSGKGSEVGSKFEELKEIIDKVNLKEKMGVCLDTCHVHDAGYDIVNDLNGVLNEFDSIIGLDKLHAIHLNDSKNPIESHKDRHETIGNGTLGLDAIKRIINHEKLKNLPFLLETPNDLQGYANEIALLKANFDD